MTGKSGKFTAFLLVIAAFAVAGCSSPVGSIGQSVPKASVYDGLDVDYTRTRVADTFFKRGDLTVYAVRYDTKEREQVTPDDVMIEYPAKSGDYIPVPEPDGHKLSTTGTIGIMVVYKNLSLKFAIEVVASDVDTTPVSSGITVRWEGVS